MSDQGINKSENDGFVGMVSPVSPEYCAGLASAIAEAQAAMNKNLTQAFYGDVSLRTPPSRRSIWQRAKATTSLVKERLSNAWDALCGRLDYDY